MIHRHILNQDDETNPMVTCASLESKDFNETAGRLSSDPTYLPKKTTPLQRRTNKPHSKDRVALQYIDNGTIKSPHYGSLQDNQKSNL